MRYDAPPFELGHTYFEGSTADATAHTELEGKIWMFEDIDYSQAGSAKPYRTGRYRYMMIARNASGGTTLTKKLLAKMKVDGSGKEFAGQVIALATTVGELCYPIDEFLSAAVPVDDLFWICVGGPATVTSAAAGDTNISIASFVIPSTGGKCIDQDTTVAAGAATFAQIQGAVGRAITAVNAINTDFLIDVTRKI